MQIFSVAIVAALLGGCNRAATVDVPEADRIECAIGGAEGFTRDCSIERGNDGATFTLHHGDGGFRRFSITADGAIAAADGAESAMSSHLADGRVQLEIGGDRYRLSAMK